MKARATVSFIAVLIALTVAWRPAYADEIRSSEWHLQYLRAEAATRINAGAGVIVSVVDTGVDASHPDLSGSVLAGATTLNDSDDGRIDRDGHGTAMAGIIAAHGHGVQAGALGIAPAAKILPVRVLDRSTNSGDGTDVSRAIDLSVSRGAQIINVSLGTRPTEALRASVERALASGVIVVASVGNTGSSLEIRAPAIYEGVLVVGAVDRTGKHAALSLTASPVAIAAPGVDIVTTGLNGTYGTGSGTSEAAAIVSGAAALVRAKYPNLSAAEVVHRLTATATDAGPPGRDEEYGYGVLNLIDALTKDVPPLQPSISSSPSPTTTSAGPGASVRHGSIPPWALVAVVLLFLLAAGGTWTAMRRRTPE
jgi:type VII secretion-associated serine protease mycosin